MSCRIGFDIGGTKVAGAALAPDGTMLARERWPVPDTYEALLALLQTAALQLAGLAGGKIDGIGLGIAGILDHRAGTVTLSKLRWLEHKPLLHDLGAKLGCPVRMANDADCFVLSEAVDGAGAQHNHVFGAILGTGVGGAQIVGKKLVTGPNGVNGEWGHVPLPYYVPEDGPLHGCHCGRTGCIETLLSGNGLVRLHRFRNPESPARAAHEIALLAGQGDHAALATLQHFYHLLAKGLSMIVMCFDPDAIIIGGGLRDLPRLYSEVPALIPNYCFVKELRTVLLPAQYDADSGVRGAAWLV